MPNPKVPCPFCGKPKGKTAKVCRACRDAHPYERTPAIRKKMIQSTAGKPKPWLKGRKRPEHSKKMKALWTPARREWWRQELLKRNPLARYHGLSCRGARLLRQAVGKCEECGSRKNLDVHHRDGDKRNQSLANLAVLCHRCHMAIHAARGECGWAAYHQKRRLSQD